MSKESGIYGFRNAENGKWYVGQTADLNKRKQQHLRHLSLGIHGNFGLQKDWQDFGEDVFEYAILELCQRDMMDIREKAWIFFYKSADSNYGYNLTSGGSTKKEISDLSREKMSIAKRGKKLNPEHKMKIIKHLYGNKHTLGYRHSEETKKKHSLARKGKSKPNGFSEKIAAIKKGVKRKAFSEEWKKKISASGIGKIPWNKGKKHTKEHIEKVAKSIAGTKRSPESCRKISEAVKASHAKRKALRDSLNKIIHLDRKDSNINPHNENEKQQQRNGTIA